MSEGTSRAEAATHILARETGRRMRAVQARIDEVEEQRKAALDAIASRLTEHDGSEARQDGLIDGLRTDLGNVQAITAAIDVAHGETRELTAAQAQELARLAQRLTANEAVDARQDDTLSEVLDRVDVLEATAPVPGPKGDRGERGERGPAGPRGAMGPPGIPGSGTSGSGSGGSGAINSVTASSGLSVTGTSDLTITNTGVRSLTGSGLTVSASTGDVTVTAPTVSGGTGISVSGSGTTALTVSASLAAGTGISLTGTTTLTVANSGVTSIVAGTGISISGATGAVTVTNSTTPVTSVTGTAPIVSSGGTTPAISVTLGTPGASAVGDTATAGTALSVARSDHKHGREAAATAGASAVGDTASAGVATTIALSDHRHSREAFGTPIAVTGGATAASGSATTVARSDHAHSTSGMPVLIASATISTSTASTTFSSIPQTFTTLWLVSHMFSTATNPTYGSCWTMARPNGDSGATYYNAGSTGTTFLDGGIAVCTNNFFSSAPSVNQLFIANYAVTTQYKSAYVNAVANNSDTTANGWTFYGYSLWKSTAAITSLVVSSSLGNMASGTKILLYGLP